MKKTFTVFYIISLFCTNVFGQLSTFYVTPVETNGSYAASQDSHFVAVNNSVSTNNKLLVFIGGTGSITKGYKYFPSLAANLGFHAVSIAYPNSVAAVSACGSSSDQSCYEDFRQEVCYGTPLSSSVSVDTLNSIHTRLVNLLKYLSITYPADGWDQFLSQDEPVWSNIVTSGHSQGSGHALYFAKTRACDRTIMFSGADDYSVYYSVAAPWIYTQGLTSVSNYYSFLDLQDDVAPYPYQYKIVVALGMTASGDDSTLVDDKSSPYNNSRCLYTNAAPRFSSGGGRYHGVPVVDIYTPLDGSNVPVFTDVWTYMLTNPTVTAVQKSVIDNVLSAYPNPVNSELYIQLPDQAETIVIRIINASGKVFLNEKVSGSSGSLRKVDVVDYPSGIYFVMVNGRCIKVVKN